MHINRNDRKLGWSVAALATAGLALGACSLDGSVYGSGVGVDHSTQPLAVGAVESIDGTYGAACTDRTGSWSVAVDPEAILLHDPLTVVMNNSQCGLTLTHVQTTGGPFAAAPSITLDTQAQAEASSFGSPVEFYANATISSLGFADDFQIALSYSDDPSAVTDEIDAGFAVTTTTATAELVPAPDYSLNMTGITVQTDDNFVIKGSEGDAVLSQGAVAGQTYAIVEGSVSGYDAVDAAYLAGAPQSLTLEIPVSAFDLLESTTPTVRSLIIANTSDGVRSYQLFEITVNSPTAT